MDSSSYESPVANPFAGLRVAVTGGTSGLGLALVQELLNRWSHVAFVARTRADVDRSLTGTPMLTALSETYRGKRISIPSPFRSWARLADWMC